MEEYIIFKSERLTYYFISGALCALVIVDIIKNGRNVNYALIVVFLSQFIVRYLTRYLARRKLVKPFEE